MFGTRKRLLKGYFPKQKTDALFLFLLGFQAPQDHQGPKVWTGTRDLMVRKALQGTRAQRETRDHPEIEVSLGLKEFNLMMLGKMLITRRTS